MGRRRKHHSGSRLASDQIPGQNQNNTCLRPCHSLWYHHQAFRDDRQITLYSLAPSNASDNTNLLHFESEHRASYYVSHRIGSWVCLAMHPFYPQLTRLTRSFLPPAQFLSLF